MNLPDWATHVAVDCEGCAYAFDAAPIFIAKGYWRPRKDRRVRFLNDSNHDFSKIPPEVARLLCVAIPRPEREEGK